MNVARLEVWGQFLRCNPLVVQRSFEIQLGGINAELTGGLWCFVFARIENLHGCSRCSLLLCRACRPCNACNTGRCRETSLPAARASFRPAQPDQTKSRGLAGSAPRRPRLPVARNNPVDTSRCTTPKH